MGVNRHDFIFVSPIKKAMILGLLDDIKVSQEVGPFSRIALKPDGAEAHRVSNLATYNDNQEARDALKQRTPFLGDRNVNLGAGLIEVQKMLDETFGTLSCCSRAEM
uniref:Glyoxalase n=1 Tax=Steinernema glaseri TaxID=37863 RepID=A0A1I7ZAN5_9BILA